MSFRSSPVETIVNKTSTRLRSLGRSTSFAPRAAKGSAFDLVRFQTEISKPALASRSAMGKPMRPRPIQPALSFPSTIIDPCLSRDSDRSAPHREAFTLPFALQLQSFALRLGGGEVSTESSLVMPLRARGLSE